MTGLTMGTPRSPWPRALARELLTRRASTGFWWPRPRRDEWGTGESAGRRPMRLGCSVDDGRRRRCPRDPGTMQRQLDLSISLQRVELRSLERDRRKEAEDGSIARGLVSGAARSADRAAAPEAGCCRQ